MDSNKQNSTIKISFLSRNETVNYAAEELGKYIRKISEEHIETILKQVVNANLVENNSIKLGTYNELGMATQTEGYSQFDDEILIDICDGKGVIAGINPRSVLLAVYRFLTVVGCRWLRPGVDGEYIPSVNINNISVKLHEKPSYRHRGICIEGAVSYENVCDIIEWAAKVGFNAYFIQFREAFTFFDRWYTHKENSLKNPEPFSVSKAREFVKNVVREIKKRDLVYHAVGHGWTCEPFGIPGLGWDVSEYNIKPEIVEFLAEVNGKREIFKGIPLNTNLCYSNPEVRRTIVSDISSYIKKHEYIDVLHFWLADGVNNHCECEGCRETIPSDFYVRMLNELDQKLTSEKINTKVVFLIYVDVLWKPQTENIKNKDRFILMFAPITRTYSKSFSSDQENESVEVSPYTRNTLKFPTSVSENLAFLESWQQIFQGDSFGFDYHMWEDTFNDPGGIQTVNVLSADIKNLKSIRLNGFLSCQCQRVFFPTGFPMYVMGNMLWDDTLELSVIGEDYFSRSFGPEGKECIRYLTLVSELFDPPYLRGEKSLVNDETPKSLFKVRKVIKEFCKIIEENLNIGNECQALSWRYLSLHAHICYLLSFALEARALGNGEIAMELWKVLKDYVQKNEDSLQKVFDVFMFINVMERKFVT